MKQTLRILTLLACTMLSSVAFSMGEDPLTLDEAIVQTHETNALVVSATDTQRVDFITNVYAPGASLQALNALPADVSNLVQTLPERKQRLLQDIINGFPIVTRFGIFVFYEIAYALDGNIVNIESLYTVQNDDIINGQPTWLECGIVSVQYGSDPVQHNYFLVERAQFDGRVLKVYTDVILPQGEQC